MQQKITEIIKKVGIKDVGFCSFESVSGKLIDCRAKGRLPQNAKTVITMIFPYRVKAEKPDFLSRYSAVPDYHRVCGKYLENAVKSLIKEFPDSNFEYFIDNSPINEVYAACLSGLGVWGENGLLINEKYGSFVFIGEIVTDLFVPAKEELKYCIKCSACKNACPKLRENCECLSKISQQKADLMGKQAELLKKYKIMWGCDICSDVCPLNQNTQTTYIKEFADGYRDSFTAGESIEDRAFAWRGEKIINRNYKNLFEKQSV